jgi:nondiscriminating glutamyl-tRNA synthetase
MTGTENNFTYLIIIPMLVTRFAPSPTGYLHIWGVRTAFYCWLLAKKHHGRYLLRIEDTDLSRSTDEMEKAIIEGFQRLGMDWDAWPGKEDDKGPYHQMQRLPIHKEYLQKLLDQGLAYEARESADELTAMRDEAEKAKRAFIYRKPEYTEAQIAAWKAEGRIPTIRLVVPQEEIVIRDHIKGEVKFHGKDIGDFVLMKSDGSPIYYFANMLDDALQGVTLVIRAEEHLSNTPKQVILYDYFGFQVPEFAHLPLVMNPNGKKLSKRDASPEFFISVHQFQEAGFLPDAILNFIAMVWWNPGTEQEIFTREELIDAFSLERVIKSNAVYDFNRALWYNSQYLSAMSDESFVDAVQDYLKTRGGDEWKQILETSDRAYWLSFAGYIKVRIQTFAQFRDYCQYFFKMLPADDSLVCREKMQATKEVVLDYLPKVIAMLETLEPWTEESIKNALIAFIVDQWLKNGQVLRPLRAILTWVEASPGAFEMLTVLGREESIKRLQAWA